MLQFKYFFQEKKENQGKMQKGLYLNIYTKIEA